MVACVEAIVPVATESDVLFASLTVRRALPSVSVDTLSKEVRCRNDQESEIIICMYDATANLDFCATAVLAARGSLVVLNLSFLFQPKLTFYFVSISLRYSVEGGASGRSSP